jgi:hypothetical protein
MQFIPKISVHLHPGPGPYNDSNTLNMTHDIVFPASPPSGISYLYKSHRYLSIQPENWLSFCKFSFPNSIQQHIDHHSLLVIFLFISSTYSFDFSSFPIALIQSTILLNEVCTHSFPKSYLPQFLCHTHDHLYADIRVKDRHLKHNHAKLLHGKLLLIL